MSSSRFTPAFVFCLPAAWLLGMQTPSAAQERVNLSDADAAALPTAGASANPAQDDRPESAAASGLAGETGSRARALFYWGDFDGDGLADAYAVQPDGAARLLRNTGDGGFEDATSVLGLEGQALPTAAAWGDFDSDGRQDLFLHSRGGPSKLLRNVDGQSFVDWTLDSGVSALGGVDRANWIDLEGDGLLDLHAISAQGHVLFHNLGRGSFEPVALDLPPVTTAPVGIVGTGGVTPLEDASQTRLSGDKAAAGTPGSSGSGSLPPGALATTTIPVTLTPFTRPSGGPVGMPVCQDFITDQATGACIQASSDPTLGLLYPLGTEFSIDSSGRVGFGTTSPQRNVHIFDGSSGVFPSTNASLVVESSGEASMSFIAPASEEQSIFFGNSASQPNAGAIVFNPFGLTGSPLPNGLILRTNDTNRLAIAEDGKIGIGTLDPDRTLHVSSGDSGAQPTTNSTLVVESDSEASISVIAPIDEESSLFLGNASSGPNAGALVFNPFDGSVPNGLSIRTADTNRIVVDQNGLIGIGTDSPQRAVHISGGDSGGAPTTNSTLVVEDDSEASISIISPIDEEASLFLGNASAGPNAGAVVFNPFDNSFPDGMVLRTADTNRLGITSGGNVGIGTNSPSHKVTIQSADEETLRLIGPDASFGSGARINFGDDDRAYLDEDVDDSLTISANGRIALMNGEVGIGTLNPARNLHVFDGNSGTSPSTNSSLVVESSSEASISLIAPSNQEQAIFFGNSASAPNAGAVLFNPFGGALPNGMILRTNDTNRLAIAANGRVGINTLSPSFTFEVNGSAGKPGGGSWSVSSDARLKKNINDLEGSLDTLLALRGVTYEYKDPASINELEGERTGFIAQEVEVVMPDWVEEVDGFKRLSIRGFEALTVEALRELDAENEELRLENEELQRRVAQLEALETKLAELSAKFDIALSGK